MVFVIDTTGSMGGLIEGAKQRVWGIVNEVMQSSSHPSVSIGLVAYRIMVMSTSRRCCH